MEKTRKLNRYFLQAKLMAFSVFLIATCIHVSPTYAINGLTVQIPKISSKDILISGVKFNADWLFSQDLVLQAEIQTISLSQFDLTFTDLKFACSKATFDGEIFQCEKGFLKLKNNNFAENKIPISIIYNHLTAAATIKIDDVVSFGGKQSLHLRVSQSGINANIKGDIGLEKIKPILTKFSPKFDLDSLEGTVKFSSKITKNSAGIIDLDADINIQELNAENSSGSGVAELNLTSAISLQITGSYIDYDIHTELLTSYFYYNQVTKDNEEFYYSFNPAKPVIIDSIGRYLPKKQALAIESMVVSQNNIFGLDLSSNITHANKLDIKQLDLDLYQVNIEPLLAQFEYPAFHFIDQPLLTLSGAISASVNGSNLLTSNYKAESNININDVNYSFDEESIGIKGLDGIINWSNTGSAKQSTVSWDSGNFNLIPFEGSVLNFLIEKDSFSLDKFKLPILGGKVLVDSVSIQDLGVNIKDYKYDFGIKVVDLSLNRLTEALSWPAMDGSINAAFPNVNFGNNLIEFGGSAKIDLFDGSMTVENMLIEDPLGVVPRMNADIEINSLDLEQLSSTLQFGRITGKLDGYARDISLEQWFPVKMDMSLYTSEDDDTKRRISQKAVDFISDIGGVGGSLSRTYLRFFEEFSYSKIGINLKLEDSICNITGIEPAANGYYIVKGSFIPRIDIVGYKSQVSWHDLVDQVKQAISSGAPVTN